MYKACGKCGKIHPYNVKCKSARTYNGGNERAMRSSWAWTIKAKEIKERANNLCEVCKQNGRYTYHNLEVHHITKVADNPDGLLDDSNLICLCVEHHKQADKGLIDKNYLTRLALMRDDKYSPVG